MSEFDCEHQIIHNNLQLRAGGYPWLAEVAEILISELSIDHSSLKGDATGVVISPLL